MAYPDFTPTELSTEEWRDIANDTVVYQVSDLGRVRRVKPEANTWVGRILKPGVDSDGYHLYILCVNGTRKTRKAHHLVALAFVGSRPSPEHQANHKDGNRQNNRATNLEWVTLPENIRHKVDVLKTQLRGEGIGASKITAGDVRQVRAWRLAGWSQQRCANALGVSQVAISCIETGKTWSHVL